MRRKRLSWRRFAKWLTRAQLEPKKVSPNEGPWTDTEIATVTDDKFHFRDYARVLTDRIVAAGTPLTIGIFGRWGSGKTSLMKLIDAALPKEKKKRGQLHSIWINVWQLSNRDEVWQAFLQALFSEVRGKLSLWHRIDKRKLLGQLARNSYRVVLVITPMIVGLLLGRAETGWGDVAELLLSPIAGGGTLVTVGLGLWTLLKPIVESAREVVSIDLQSVLKHAPYEAQVTELMQLQEQFEKMVKVLVRKDGRLVVFIDDLDRCSPDKIPEVLEALKLFTTTPRCVYVMGLDHDLTRQGVVKKYEFSEDEGAEYLEKIVQIPFHLPPLDDDRIAAFVGDEYSKVREKCDTAAKVFSLGLEPNPRKVKRALNIYRTLLDLADVRVKSWDMDPVNEELLAKMVVIQSRFRTLHEHLVQNPTFLLQVEKAVEDGLDSASLKDDEEVGSVLLGKPETDTSKAVPGLIDEIGWSALSRMLGAGNRRFNDPDQRRQVSSYIYLTSTAEGGVERVRPSREERDVLLGGDRAGIEKLVGEIQKRGEDEETRQRTTEAYIERLEGVLSDISRYTAAERVSANIALDSLEGWKPQDIEPETLRIPAGPFLMGTLEGDIPALLEQFGGDRSWYETEVPQQTLDLPAFRISRHPVTNAEYQTFVRATGHGSPEHWDGEDFPEGKGDHPVVWVSWRGAVAYCEWLSEQTGRVYRLPTEAEWEKAARGTDGRIFPWGDEWDETRLNSAVGGPWDTTPVGQYSPHGDSPYGVADVAGNVWEWCRTKWQDSYEGYRDDNDLEGDAPRVLRGGAFSYDSRRLRCAFRNWLSPLFRHSDVGFRVVVAPDLTSGR